MKLDVAEILCFKCLLLLGCYHASGSEDFYKSDHKHRTQKAAEKHNELWCYKCFTMDHNKEYCMNVSRNETSMQHKCQGDFKTCMVKRISYTLNLNGTSVNRIWSLERNCTQKCESGCIIIGERTKIYACSTCCENSFCNSGRGGAAKLTSNKYFQHVFNLINIFSQYQLIKYLL